MLDYGLIYNYSAGIWYSYNKLVQERKLRRVQASFKDIKFQESAVKPIIPRQKHFYFFFFIVYNLVPSASDYLGESFRVTKKISCVGGGGGVRMGSHACKTVIGEQYFNFTFPVMKVFIISK